MMRPMPFLTDLLAQRGPLTGAELLAATGETDALALWRTCHREGLCCRRTGHRYMRLDRDIDGYARLSPSIRREFLTYTLIGLDTQRPLIEARAARLEQQAAEISEAKLNLARESLCFAMASLPDESHLLRHVTFLIAGDITYHMAHRVPRPEHSSGQLVRGSDLDIIAVTTDDLPEPVFRALDDAIYRQKHYLLVNPEINEEIDYILKPMARVREQLTFSTFEHMVACKILCEAQPLYGSPFLFQELMQHVEASGVRHRLQALHQQAENQRNLSEQILLDLADGADAAPFLPLFHTREENDEIY